MRLTNLSQFSMMIAQIVFLISIFVVDLTQSSDSAAAFSSVKKVTSSENSLSSNRHKRRVLDEGFFGDDDSEAQQTVNALKRAPGWGKRFYGAQKRAPGWGKRSDLEFDDDDDQDAVEKRAPGWGKRAPGWGKRAPGWGKRAPGWGKRAPGWGKRSSSLASSQEESADCKIMSQLALAYATKARQMEESRLEAGCQRYDNWEEM